MPSALLKDRLEQAVAEWAGRETQRHARRMRRELLAREDERSPARALAEAELARLFVVPAAERSGLVDGRGWGEEGIFLGCLLLDEAERLPLGDRIDLARLAGRVSALAEIAPDSPLASLLDDNLGRAGLLEVRALRRRGELEAARRLFVEWTQSFEEEESPRAFWLTLNADRAVTAGLLALDEYRPATARDHFERAARYFRVAGSEEDDAVLLFGRARLDLLQGQPEEAVDRLIRAPAFENPGLRLAALDLLVRAALFTRLPAVARPPLVALTAAGARRPAGNDRLVIGKAAVAVLEGQPREALELLASARRRLRQEGKLLDSLAAALVASRAELARHRRREAAEALRSGLLEEFNDVPRTTGVVESLYEIGANLAGGAPALAFLDRMELWLVCVEDSPGVGMPPQA